MALGAAMAAVGQNLTFTPRLRAIPLQTDFTAGWPTIHVGLERDAVSIYGVALCRHQWRQLSEEAVVVRHPSYPSERHSARVHALDIEGRTAKFSACELSKGVWGFYPQT